MSETPKKKLTIVRYSDGETDVVLNVVLEDMTSWILQVPKKELTEEKIREVLREKLGSRDQWQQKSMEY